MGSLTELSEGLWTAEAPLRFLGVEVGARMTVIRLPDGSLALHSPIAGDSERVQEVRALGSVSHIIAPNKFHHLYAGDWKACFPDAVLHGAPGLAEKRQDLRFDHVLGDAAHPAWRGLLDQVAFEGFPFANEVVFFHRPSATLILCDVAFNMGAKSPPLTRLFVRLVGRYGALGPTLVEKLLIRDREAFRSGLERVLEWPFERVIVAHGEICEADARAQLRRGYDWLLD